MSMTLSCLPAANETYTTLSSEFVFYLDMSFRRSKDLRLSLSLQARLPFLYTILHFSTKKKKTVHVILYIIIIIVVFVALIQQLMLMMLLLLLLDALALNNKGRFFFQPGLLLYSTWGFIYCHCVVRQ